MTVTSAVSFAKSKPKLLQSRSIMSAYTQTTLVTGASRGIGKGLVEHLAKDPSHLVIGTVRGSSSPFDAANIKTIQLDQSVAESVTAAAKGVDTIDTLIINGAIGEDEKLLTTSDERMQEYLNVNVIGVLRTVRAFLPALRAGKLKKIVLISSIKGSITRQVNATPGFSGPYAVTKAAVNMLAVQLHNELSASEGFTVVPIHPGWVSTDMGNSVRTGGIPVPESAAGIIDIVNGLTRENSATFYQYDGANLPW